ncbi:MAG: phosphoribosyl-AMP cyclohydrolase [Candidatus Ratteibacteria bacterium]|nr:phosphoribosyl-AMP cyclohydrolase [Candidatus Ratteibacteria bacterium]
MDIFSEIKFNKSGLVPAVIQDSETNQVLMQAYMNEESVRLSLKTGLAHFYSRSRKKIWRKGEKSGNVQEIKEIFLDCDGDSLLIKAKQKTAACHLGYKSCFFRKLDQGKWGIIAPKIFDPEKAYGKK